MDDKRYSLNDIFAVLQEATQVLTSKSVTIVSEDDSGKTIRTDMSLSEAIAMMVAHEMTWDMSRLSSETTMATKGNVIEALKANHYDEITYPVYESFGIRMQGGKRRQSRRNRFKDV